MTLYHCTHVECDVPGCDKEVVSLHGPLDAFLDARALGWSRQRIGEHLHYFCPKHRKPKP